MSMTRVQQAEMAKMRDHMDRIRRLHRLDPASAQREVPLCEECQYEFPCRTWVLADACMPGPEPTEAERAG